MSCTKANLQISSNFIQICQITVWLRIVVIHSLKFQIDSFWWPSTHIKEIDRQPEERKKSLPFAQTHAFAIN